MNVNIVLSADCQKLEAELSCLKQNRAKAMKAMTSVIERYHLQVTMFVVGRHTLPFHIRVVLRGNIPEGAVFSP